MIGSKVWRDRTLANLYTKARTLSLDKIMLRLDYSDCYSLLDLGCGSAEHSSVITELPVPRKIGVDAFRPYIESRKKEGKYSDYILSDVMSLSFPNNSFDVITAMDLIEHLDRPSAIELLDRMNRWARKKVIVFTPNGYIDNPISDYNNLQVHRSGFRTRDFAKRGYRVYGINGWKPLRKVGAAIRFEPIEKWDRVSSLSSLVTYKYSGLAFQLLCIKEKA